jgi:hypothetical protein
VTNLEFKGENRPRRRPIRTAAIALFSSKAKTRLTSSVVQVWQLAEVVVLWDRRSSIDAWPPRALRRKNPARGRG